jgi:hypothetical protein
MLLVSADAERATGRGAARREKDMTHSNRTNPDLDSRPAVRLVGSGYHLYRDYLLRRVPCATQVWLVLDEPTWERPYAAGYEVVDTLDALTKGGS